MHREGRRRCQVELTHLLAHITADERNGRLHFGDHPLGFVDPIETPLAELFVRSHGANCLKVSPDIGGDEVTVSTHPAFKVDKVVGLADGLTALCDPLAWLGQALGRTASRFKGLSSLLEIASVFAAPSS